MALWEYVSAWQSQSIGDFWPRAAEKCSESRPDHCPVTSRNVCDGGLLCIGTYQAMR